MKTYRSKYNQIKGSSHVQVMREARYEYHKIQKRTPRRQAYVRSAYFKKDKVFINQFWDHLRQKSPGDQVRRLKLYLCAIDLIRNSKVSPDTIYTYLDMNTALHRFHGIANDGKRFEVQVKEDKRTNRKDFMSVFPSKNS